MALSEEQQRIRMTGIGASEIAAIVGKSRWSTPFDIWARKRGQLDPYEETKPQKRGRILEPSVLAWWSEDSGLCLRKSPGTIRHPTISIALATPDAYGSYSPRGKPIVYVEAKTGRFGARAEWGPEGSDEIPAEYLLQTVWGLGVSGLPEAQIPVLFGGDDFRIYRVNADPELFGVLADAAQKFWRDHVEGETAPAIDDSDAASAYLKKRFPSESGDQLLDATAEIERVANRISILKQSKKLTEAELTATENAIREIIGDKLGIVGGFGKVTWKKNRDGTKTDWETVARSLRDDLVSALTQPEIGIDEASDAASFRLDERIEEFTAPTPGARVLRWTWAKKTGEASPE